MKNNDLKGLTFDEADRIDFKLIESNCAMLQTSDVAATDLSRI
jgi:hypothetical protein